MDRFRPATLYPIVDVGPTGAAAPLRLADEILGAGVPWVQLRMKLLAARDQVAIAAILVERAATHGARVIVNDRLDVAIASRAGGVHLGQNDLPLHAAAPLARAHGLVVGISTHDAEQARAAEAGGADYIGFGPLFRTATKRDALSPRAVGALARIRRATDLPIVAIGGITEERAPHVLEAGADSVAMISAFAHADDPARLTRSILALRPDQSS